MAEKLTVVVEKGKGERNFTCFATETVLNASLLGYGATARQSIDDFRRSVAEVRAIREAEGKTWPELEFSFKFDVGSFFDYYPLNVSAFAEYAGINPTQMRQYTSAAKEPRQTTLDKIRRGMAQLLQDMGTGPLAERPVTSY